MNKNKKVGSQSKEFFDLGFNLLSWSNDAQNYEIIAKLIPKVRESHDVIEILDEINQLLNTKNLPHIFDGTIDSLKYFIDKYCLDVDKIENAILREIVLDCLNQEGKTNLKVNQDRWSGQALRCKAILVGLYLRNGKLQIASKISRDVGCFTMLNESDFPLFGDDIEKGKLSDVSMKRLTSLNATWVGLASLSPWGKGKTKGIDKVVVENMVDSFHKESDYHDLFIKLQPHIDKIASKYFPGFHKTDHRACVAVRHATLIVLYRVIDNLPEKVKRHPKLRVDGMFNKWLEYIFTDDFEFQDWFIEYLEKEVDKRVKFLRMMADEHIYMKIDPRVERYMKKTMGKNYRPPKTDRLYYLPIFESFRFVPPGSVSLFGRLVTLFHNRDISIVEKEVLVRNIVFNIQKLIVINKDTKKSNSSGDSLYDAEKAIKESFMMLFLDMLVPLARSIMKKQYKYLSPRKGDFDDLKQIIDTELLDLILKYDSTKNSSFFGYMKIMLPLNVKSRIREKKINDSPVSLEKAMDSNFEGVAVEENYNEMIDRDDMQKKISKYLEKLPEKEKSAIKNAFYNNSRLSATERRAKNRGLQRLRQQYPELKHFIVK